MGLKKIISISIFLLIITAVYAIEQKSYFDINMMKNNIYNATWVNATNFAGSGQYLTDLPVGGAGEPHWIDGGTYLYPNSSYAINVWIQEGYLNVTSWLKVYDDVTIYGNLDLYGNLLVDDNTTISGYVQIGNDTDINGTLGVTQIKIGG